MDKYSTLASLVVKAMVKDQHASAWSLISELATRNSICLTRKDKVFILDIVRGSFTSLQKGVIHGR